MGDAAFQWKDREGAIPPTRHEADVHPGLGGLFDEAVRLGGRPASAALDAGHAFDA